ncbi:hypothetical protein ACFE04_013515 [Oxalis oulophora]
MSFPCRRLSHLCSRRLSPLCSRRPLPLFPSSLSLLSVLTPVVCLLPLFLRRRLFTPSVPVAVDSLLPLFPSPSIIVHKKTAAALCLTTVKNEDKFDLSKILEATKANFNDKFDEVRKKWGGGIMGSKSQAKTKAKQGLLAN